MRPELIVWPDGLWLVRDELGSTIAKGTWKKLRPSHVVAHCEGTRRRCASDRRRDELFCRAVTSMVAAMGEHDA